MSSDAAPASLDLERSMMDAMAERRLLGSAALLLAASAATTVAWGGAMSTIVEICGGPAMSMAWIPMPGETWHGAATSFLAMWGVMMTAMMLPSLVPMLLRYRAAVGGAGEPHSGRRTALVGGGYFFVWTVLGSIVFPVGAALATAAMDLPVVARVMPFAAGAVVVIAGALQLTAWKVHRLRCCRALPADCGTAWRHGMSLGLRCARCCGNLMAILLVVGVMDLRAMVVVTAAITAERLAPDARIARAIGVIAVATGVLLIARAAGLG